ncbi:sensor histidine kinase [Undibacterium terreum]|uniref:Histidine kinase n=1 Tax=Undibacterium terreum TaxID=1224302 RepID=A0A916UB14_9BURK|nr:sensor histidine kinase [Undibacterium terreum]GGC64508.1 histidine kinase [Undibacterium terreum]
MIAMHHTAWGAKDGAPGRVTSMAQTPDGWLWLATSRGLFRFDGVSFEKYQSQQQPLSSSNVSTVGTLPSGALWIAYRLGGLSLLQNGKIIHLGSKDGLPGSAVRFVVQDQDGGIWIGTPSGLLYKEARASSWHLVKIDGVSERTRISSMLLDDRGTLWVRTLEATVSLARGEKEFRRVADGGSFGQIAKAPDGSIWMCDLDKPGIQMLSPPLKGQAPHFPDLPASNYLFFDPQGNLWLTPNKEFGVMRVEREDVSARISTIDEPQSLTGTPNAVLVDQEGNIWIGTGKGVDRFRRNRLEAIDTPDYIADARPFAAGPNGSLRVDRYILEHPGQQDAKTTLVGPAETSKNITTNVYNDPDGSFWIGAIDGLAHILDGKRIDIDPPSMARKDGPVSGLVKDRQGRLWMARGKTYALENGVWTEGGGIPELKSFTTNVLFCDSRGRIWFGGIGNQIAILDGTQIRLRGDAEGLHLGSIKQITEHDGEFWIGGESGVARYDGKHFTNIMGTGSDSFAGASGLIFNAKGSLWINGLDGISGISAEELGKAKRDAAYKVKFQRYDFLDGLKGTPSQFPQTPTAILGTDGKMWFGTSYGIYHVDPDQMQLNPLRPTVAIRHLRSGDNVFDSESAQSLSLPPGTTSAQIAYTALSLTVPERMQFRYRLDGVDKTWQDAGNRRTAFYTGLEPGSYHFHVIASNNDGLWNDTGATLDFTIQPSFIQTLWFKLLCAIAALFLLYIAYRWRLDHVTRRMRERLQERLLERERIARTLHDTLLQGVQILTMRFQFAIDRLPADLPERLLMEKALDAADQVVVDARNQVMDLRSAPDISTALNHMVVELTESMQPQQKAACEARVTGEPRELKPFIREEIVSIAREAVINALKHADASRIEIRLDYSNAGLLLTVKDDGCGIAPAILNSGSRAGHWGIPGMRERAAELKTTLVINSGNSAGTEILLSVAAQLAYSEAAHSTPWSNLKARVKILMGC